MTVVAVILALVIGAPVSRPYHKVPVANVATTRWTHVRSCGLVTYVRAQSDGDVHVTLEHDGYLLVLEIVPHIALPSPRKGQFIEAWGIVRIDKGHRSKQYPDGWPELHPLEGWSAVSTCTTFLRVGVVRTRAPRGGRAKG